MLLASLFLFTLLMALGLGLMSSQTARRKSALAQKEALQAKSLALAAWADVKTKLGKDLFFPPSTDGQGHFSYGEDVYDSDGRFYGSYTVVIDTRYVSQRRADGTNAGAESKHNVNLGYYLVTCIGKVGQRGRPPVAERSMYFEVEAGDFKVIRVQDRESL